MISDLFNIYDLIVECLILLILIEKQNINGFKFIKYLSNLLDKGKNQQIITILLSYYYLPSNPKTKLLITNSISLLFLLIDGKNIYNDGFYELQYIY